MGPTESSAGSGRAEALSEVLAKQTTGKLPHEIEPGWSVAEIRGGCDGGGGKSRGEAVKDSQISLLQEQQQNSYLVVHSNVERMTRFSIPQQATDMDPTLLIPYRSFVKTCIGLVMKL